MKFEKKWIVLLLLLPVILFLVEWAFAPGGLKSIYYNFFRYDADKVKVAVDPNFIFFEKGYTKTLKLNSKYYVSHRILLIPNSKTVPVDYKYSGQIKIEFFIKDKLLQSFLVETPSNIWRGSQDDYYGNYIIYGGKQKMYAKSTFAFELVEVPFELFRMKWNRLREMQIRITVIKADEQLKSFCNSAELIVIPDLRL